MDVTAILARFLDEPRVARVRAVLDTYGRAAGGLLANGLAFSALFAAIPTMLLVLGLAGAVANDPAVRQTIGDALIAAFPPLEDLIDAALDAISSGAVAVSVLALIGLVWTVSQLYGALDVAFARIFSDTPERDIVRRTARGLLVVGILGAVIVGFVIAAALATAVDSATHIEIPFARSLAALAGWLPFLTAISIGGVLIIYRTLPPKAPAWRSAAAAGGHRRRGLRGPDPGLHVPGAATRRRRRPGGLDRIRVRGPGLAVVLVPGAALRRGLGPGARGRAASPGVSRPGGCRSAGRTGRWRTVTARS